MPLRIINPGEMTERRSIRRRRRLTEEEKLKAIKWRRDGMTYEKIGVLLGGVPPSTLERYLRGVKPENRIKALETPPPQERPTPATERPAPSWLDLYLLVTRLNRGDFDSPEAFIKEEEGLIGPVPEGDREVYRYMWNEAMRTNKEARERHEWEQEQMKKLSANLTDAGKRGGDTVAQTLTSLCSLVSSMSDSISLLLKESDSLNDRVDSLSATVFGLQTSVNMLYTRVH